MNKYEQKMNELDAVFVDDSSDVSASELDIKTVEQKLNCQLPDDYREFLRNYGMYFFRSGVLAPVINGGENRDSNGNGWIGVDVFYSATSNHAYGLLENYETYHGVEMRMPSELLPIADVGSGSQICLAISGLQEGSIFFWDRHEASSTIDYDNVHFIASSFDEFMNLLQSVERPSD